jgi:rubredoxin
MIWNNSPFATAIFGKIVNIHWMAERYRCTICGYIYDPEKGEPREGVPPGTPFERLPFTFRCPECHAYAKGGGRRPFVKLEE